MNIKLLEYVGVALVVALYTIAAFHAGGMAPRAKLAALEASIQTAHDAQVAEDKRREDAHQQLIKGLNDAKTKSVADARAAWAAYNGLRAAQGRTGGNAQPVQIVAGRCDDTAGNDAVSSAVSEYRNGVVAAVGRFRDEIARILEQAQGNTDALVRLQEWAKGEQIINR